MIGPHMRTIIAVISPPMRAETKVSAPRMSVAPREAKRRTNQDISRSPEESPKLGPTKVSQAEAVAASRARRLTLASRPVH